MKKEIDELRAQVAELTAEREAGKKEQARAGGSEGAAGEPAADVTAAAGSTATAVEQVEPEGSELTSQFQELFDTVDEELRAANPLTVLVVFALGVLMGRLLPR